MLIKTLLQKCYPVKGFVYGKVSLQLDTITIQVAARKNSKGLCSCCKQPAATYDHLKERRFKFIPLWGYKVELVYTPRRVDCANDGVKVEHILWADGKSPVCKPFKTVG